MDTELLIKSDAVAWARLTNGDRTIHLALSLGDEFTGGKLVRLERGVTLSIQGADELALRHGFATWSCGLISGALFAFRSLQIPRQEVLIHECSGRLGSSDMEAVAQASALAICKLANREMPEAELVGWERVANILPVVLPLASSSDATIADRGGQIHVNGGNVSKDVSPAKKG